MSVDYPPCNEEVEEAVFTMFLSEMTEWMQRIESKVDKLVDTLARFQPLIERYEQTSRAGKALADRKVRKHG